MIARIYRTCRSLSAERHDDNAFAMIAGCFITAIYGMFCFVVGLAAIVTVPVWIVPYILWHAYHEGGAR